MRFFVPLTTSRNHIDTLTQRLNHEGHSQQSLYARTIISPLFCRPSTLDMVKRHRDTCCVMFDSGGFYAQQGRVSLLDLVRRLEVFYTENRWADYYVLPDNPPTPKDSPNAARTKSRQTVQLSAQFYASMPEALQGRAIGVIHAVSERELDWLVDQYSSLGIRYLAFGTFGMSGPSLAINRITYSSLEVLVHLSRRVHDNNSRLHLFGVGNPAQIVIFRSLGISSFDSSSWLRTAAFGNVYLPFLGAFNISGRTTSRRHRTREEFELIREETGHGCGFCRDFDALRDNWVNRALHNLLVMNETVERIGGGKDTANIVSVEQLLGEYNPQFLRYWTFAREMLV